LANNDINEERKAIGEGEGDIMLFDRNIEPSCTYCSHSTDIGRGEIVCVRHGIMAGSGYCGAFRYEPTKRVPQVFPGIKTKGLSQKDFAL